MSAASTPLRAARGAAALLLVPLLLAGCAGDLSLGLVGPTTPIPVEAPKTVSANEVARQTADREHEKLVAAFGGEVAAPRAAALLAEVTARLVPATERPNETYRITILDSPTVNAFALPSGRLYVTRGLLALANDTAELAGVIAHEIAHVTVRHASARSEMALRSALVKKVVSDVLNDPAAGAKIEDEAKVTIAGFSRAQELEADQIAVQTLARAKYDPYGAARFLASLGRQVALGASAVLNEGQAPDKLSSHPSTPERVSQALLAARRIGAPGLGEADRERLLVAVDGLAYGDNPRDGMVSGRRFIHPRLGIAFEAPSGYGLENTARAVVGVTADGGKRLLFDALDSAESKTLEEILRSTWSDGMTLGPIERRTVDDLTVAISSAKTKDWAFRVAAIRGAAATFRLILAARGEAPDLEADFSAALASVRRITAEEAQALRPPRLLVVTAEVGDTAESLGGRMFVADRGAERFAVLNGIERGAALRAGERYKLVAE